MTEVITQHIYIRSNLVVVLVLKTFSKTLLLGTFGQETLKA